MNECCIDFDRVRGLGTEVGIFCNKGGNCKWAGAGDGSNWDGRVEDNL